MNGRDQGVETPLGDEIVVVLLEGFVHVTGDCGQVGVLDPGEVG